MRAPNAAVAQRRRERVAVRLALIGISGLLVPALSGASAGSRNPMGRASDRRSSVDAATHAQTSAYPIDYANASNWLARPSSPTKNVDVFYLYPTSYIKSSPTAPVISTIHDSGMVDGAKTAFAEQATAFDTVANVYAPYYRQADAVTVLSSPIATQTAIISGTPTHDATAAFAYYIAHYNHGRPFILAGHSQGSNVLIFLLSGYLKQHPAVYRRMIAAYVIGYGVTHSYLAANPQLSFATGASDTGVIVSWNTEAPGLTIPNPVVQPGSIAINPITWTRSQRPAYASRSLGSLLPNSAGVLTKVDHYADARVDKARGVIVCSTCSVADYAPGKPGGFPRGIFHMHDYMFYYYDLRHNAAVRIQSFLDCSGCGRG
jgi:hypothetical protein